MIYRLYKRVVKPTYRTQWMYVEGSESSTFKKCYKSLQIVINRFRLSNKPNNKHEFEIRGANNKGEIVSVQKFNINKEEI